LWQVLQANPLLLSLLSLNNFLPLSTLPIRNLVPLGRETNLASSFPPAAQGLQGLQGFLAAQGLHGLQGFLAAQGLHGLQGFLAAQGLQGLDDEA